MREGEREEILWVKDLWRSDLGGLWMGEDSGDEQKAMEAWKQFERRTLNLLDLSVILPPFSH